MIPQAMQPLTEENLNGPVVCAIHLADATRCVCCGTEFEAPELPEIRWDPNAMPTPYQIW